MRAFEEDPIRPRRGAPLLTAIICQLAWHTLVKLVGGRKHKWALTQAMENGTCHHLGTRLLCRFQRIMQASTCHIAHHLIAAGTRTLPLDTGLPNHLLRISSR